MILKNPLLTITIFFVFTISPLSIYGQSLSSDQSVEIIETFNDTLLECMKNGNTLGYAGRYALLEPVMEKSFFFHYMAKKSIGSYWRNLDEDQQKQLLGKYITWSIGTFAKRFKEYKGQQFVIVSSENFRNKYHRVVSHFLKVDRKIRKFEYVLLKDKKNWRIIDIQIEGVSQLSFTRSQFKSVLKDRGIEGLFDVLDEKINNLYID